MGRPTSAAAATRARNRRRAARRAATRATVQLVAVLVGGVLAGGLAVAAALPGAADPLPDGAVLAGAGTVALATVWVARRLRPVDQGRSRR